MRGFMRLFIRSGCGFLITACLAFSQAAAQADPRAASTPAPDESPGPPAAEAPRPGTWIINGSEHFCSIGRSTQDEPPITFSVRVVPGTGSAELLLVSPDWQSVPLDDGEEVQILLEPGGASFTHAPRAGRMRNRQPIVAFLTLPNGFVDAFAAGNSLRIVRGGETKIQFSYRQADRAVAAMQECARYTLEQWGVDQAAWANLSRRPSMIRPWLNSNDYPITELQQGFDGGVTVVVTVDATGSITRCRVVSASGHRGFDRAACGGARGRGFFRPALDASGQPVAADIVQRIRFQVAFY